MDTVEVTLAVPSLEQDRFIGWLENWATGFHQTDAQLKAYIPAADWSGTLRERLEARLQADGYSDVLAVQNIGDRNWNTEWEDSLSPVRVGPFLLCPTDHDVPDEHADATVLRIDPQQSFGTGHHASTRLTLRLLIDAVSADDTFVDVGTGTGVLAIAACRLGVHSILGVDIDSGAVTNALNNVAQNGVADRVTIREGSIEAIPSDTEADVLAANIKLDTILDLLSALRTRLAPDGDLLLSGLLTSQRGRMLDGLSEHDFTSIQEKTEDGWWAVRCQPRTSREE